MQSSQAKQSIFVVTGMHRSGTSFTASLLQSAGLDIGQKLIGPGQGNIRGFFESYDFVEFHQMVLRSQGANDVGWTLQETFDVEDQFVERAKGIISSNSSSSVWGWKDPRTTLFLDFWLELLPNANFLLIYRSPWEVIDSLYRRGDELFLEHPELAVKIWMHYNRKVLEFYDKVPEQCLLVSVSNIANKTETFIREVNEKFKVSLVTPNSNIYDQSLFNTQVSNIHRSTLVSHYFPEALEIYQELCARGAEVNNVNINPPWHEKVKPSFYRTWAFQDWSDIRNLERQVKNLQSELESSQSQLKQVQVELEALSINTHADISEED